MRFEINTEGRDFVVGDIHGEFTKLQSELDKRSFDTSVDRLFAVGDLVDRGPESELSLEWLAKPWFHSVLGNHEQMAIDYSAWEAEPDIYIYNGGSWFIELDKNHRKVFVDEFKKLPLWIEIDTPNGLVGIVHAECLAESWEEFKLNLAWYENSITWGRSIITAEGLVDEVHGVNRIYVGHSPVKNPGLLVGNHCFIDSGAVFTNGKLHLEQINVES